MKFILYYVFVVVDYIEILLFCRKALQSADNILITLRYPDNAKALTVKGEALYNMGDFEHALVCFHRAMRTASTKVWLKPANSYDNIFQNSELSLYHCDA